MSEPDTRTTPYKRAAFFSRQSVSRELSAPKEKEGRFSSPPYRRQIY